MSSTGYGYDVAAQAFLENGADHVFGLVGDSNVATIARMVQQGSTFRASRHEAGVVAMATGFAVASDSVGLASVTKGPGVTNGITALISAARDRVPLVLFTAGTPKGDVWGPQYIEHEVLATAAGARFLHCEDGTAIASTVGAAFTLAETERRPVFLDIYHHVLHDEAKPQTGWPVGNPLADAHLWEQPPDLESELAKEAARLLAEAHKPVVLAGRGAVYADAGRVLRELASAAGALLVTTLPVSGLFYGDEYALEHSGAYATATTRELLAEADVVLAVGASLNSYTTMDGRLYDEATVIHCDVQEKAVGALHHADLALIADAKEAGEAILRSLMENPRRDAGFRTPEVRHRIATSRGARDLEDNNGPAAVDPRVFLRALDAAVGGTGRIVVDIGHFSTFPCQCLTARYAGQILPAFGFGAIGLALPTAIGASLATPEQRTVAVVGDGGLLMSLTELETMTRLKPNVILVIMNDGAYSADAHHLRRYGLPVDVAHYGITDFSDLAMGFGLDAVGVWRPDQIPSAMDRVGRGQGPLVLDVRVNPDVVAYKFQTEETS